MNVVFVARQANDFVKQCGHANYGHYHTRRICLMFFQLLPTICVGNEKGNK